MLTWAEKLQHFVKLQKTSLLLFEFSHVCIAQSTNLQSLKVILKKWLFHTPMIFKGFDTEKRGWG